MNKIQRAACCLCVIMLSGCSSFERALVEGAIDGFVGGLLDNVADSLDNYIEERFDEMSDSP